MPLYAPPVLARFGRAAIRLFGYDATDTKTKRKPPDGILSSEDAELTPDRRRKLVSAGRDIGRNFTLAGWMVRKHLDYVSTFNFQSKTGDKNLDRLVESLMKEWSKAENCDVAGRHTLPRMIRMIEQARTIDGDIGLVRLADGRLQAIEGDRIRMPNGGVPGNHKASDFCHGVHCDEAGRALEYAVCKRGKTSDFSPNNGTFTFERTIPAANMWLHAYFTRFDQVRGIAPLAPAINTLRDIYEGCDYALAKMKIAQLFGLAVMRQSEEELAPTEDDGTTGRKKIDFGSGPVVLDMNVGEDAKFLESHSPSLEFQQFCGTTIGIALKGLDIPYSFYAENFTNFSGQRQAWIQYDLSARSKRQDNIDLLDAITRWRLALWIIEGKLPATLDLSVPFWRWVSVGVPWIDPLKEVQADVEALAAFLTSRTRILKENGEDFEEILEERKKEDELLAAAGYPTTVSASANKPQNVEVTPANAA